MEIYEKLELVQTNLCGQLRMNFLSGNKYFVLFVDDLTRMTWFTLLVVKYQVFSIFKAMVERESG